jgi:hypothetical protein
MTFLPSEDGNRLDLAWTPDAFAGNDGTTGTAGLWRFTVTASDGAARFTRTLEIQVANVNQTPRILPLPLQLLREGETLAFTVKSADADNDAVQLSLIRDETTPAGVSFNGATGYFEWTPDQDTVNHLQGSDKAFTFTFRASDGQASSEQTVQVRVFDVNRPPQITVSHHAIVLGESLTLPVSGVGGQETGDGNGIRVSDPDGIGQTQNLSVSFSDLPEGATYDASARSCASKSGYTT